MRHIALCCLLIESLLKKKLFTLGEVSTKSTVTVKPPELRHAATCGRDSDQHDAPPYEYDVIYSY